MPIDTDERASAAGGGPSLSPTTRKSAVPAAAEWSQERDVATGRRRAILLMAAGMAVLTLAATTLIPRFVLVSAAAGPGTRQPTSGPASSGVAIGGPTDVAAQMATYAPGQSSGWHAHTGLHAVVVLAGTLTIIDSECQRRTFGPGESYVGGRDAHLAINQSASPVEMAVTYMFPAGVPHTTFHLPALAPARCEAG